MSSLLQEFPPDSTSLSLTPALQLISGAFQKVDPRALENGISALFLSLIDPKEDHRTFLQPGGAWNWDVPGEGGKWNNYPRWIYRGSYIEREERGCPFLWAPSEFSDFPPVFIFPFESFPVPGIVREKGITKLPLPAEFSLGKGRMR